jgi:hypothetical protein
LSEGPPELAKDADPVRRVEYLIETNTSKFIIAIPSSYKVTFGQLHPGQKAQYGSEPGNTLRIYETATQQRAVFNGVRAFRDLSIPLKKLRKITESEAAAKSDGKGNKSAASSVTVEEIWEEEKL